MVIIFTKNLCEPVTPTFSASELSGMINDMTHARRKRFFRPGRGLFRRVDEP